MNLAAFTSFVARVRDHYVDQFRDFIKQQLPAATAGASEIKLKLNGESELFGDYYCVDLIKKEGADQSIGKDQILELLPDRNLEFSALRGEWGRASITIKHLRWDDIEISHNAGQLPNDSVSSWFRRWFDLDDERLDPNAEVSEIIHSLLVQPNYISIDLGTAPPDAFVEMLMLLEAAGATEITVTSSRAEAEAPK